MIEFAFLFMHLVAQVVSDEFYDSQPGDLGVGVALEEEEEVLLHEVELGEIVDWMAD